ncbi:MAG: type II secretion system protein [Candidatus Shapirobacteria bacterium]
MVIKNKMRGFTLVELLIVIALIAILSVAVLATINPIEQSNKARDAKFKNDAAEVLSAYERYYASKNVYPWQDVAIGAANTIAQSSYIGSTEAAFGVLSSTGTTGVLITSSELKSSFANKEPFVTGVSLENRLYTTWNGSDSSWVCFCPKAKINREDTAKVRCIYGVAGAYVVGSGCSLPPSTASDYCGLVIGANAASSKGNMMCVPE